MGMRIGSAAITTRGMKEKDMKKVVFYIDEVLKNKDDDKKIKEIEPVFNKAILFDTTQHSWHGFPEPINPPQGKMRKSFAVYYMTDITSTAEERYRARYVGV